MLLAVMTLFPDVSNAQDMMPAARYFTEAPADVIPLIPKNTRLDMLDYFHAGSDRPSANEYDGPCFVISEDSLSVTFMNTATTKCQIFVLNHDSKCPIIGLIQTFDTPTLESAISFYDCQWQPLAKSPLQSPKLDQWLTPEGRKQRALVQESIPFILSKAAYSPRTHAITFTLTLPDYFSEQDKPEALGLLREQLFYQWNGKKFKQIK